MMRMDGEFGSATIPVRAGIPFEGNRIWATSLWGSQTWERTSGMYAEAKLYIIPIAAAEEELLLLLEDELSCPGADPFDETR